MSVFKNSKSIKLEELQDKEDNWLDREELGDENEQHVWLEEGVELYSNFIRLEPNVSRYRITLANLYLQWGRDEKIRLGNKQEAARILRKAIRTSPQSPDPYYHLSFLMADAGRREEQWESSLFYAKEALEYNLDEEKKVKLLCNMALGYMHLKLREKAEELILEAGQLDKQNKSEIDWFVQLYADKLKTVNNRNVLHKIPEQDREVVSRGKYEEIRERAFDGKCVVLDLSRVDKYFYGKYDAPRLEGKEAGILGYLMERSNEPCSKEEIEKAVWIGERIGRTAVPRYISTIRSKLKRALKREDINASVLIKENDSYVWKLDMEHHVLR